MHAQLPNDAIAILEQLRVSGMSDLSRDALLDAIDNPVLGAPEDRWVWHLVKYDRFVQVLTSLDREQRITFREEVLKLPVWNVMKGLDCAVVGPKIMGLSLPEAAPRNASEIFGTLDSSTQQRILEVCRAIQLELEKIELTESDRHVRGWLKALTVPAPRARFADEERHNEQAVTLLRKALLAQFRAIGAPV